MTTETESQEQISLDVTDDLAAFEAEMYGKTPAKEEKEPEPAPEPKAEAEPAPEGEEAPVTDPEEEKNRSANRFTKQTRELREAQRVAKALEAELAALKAPKPAPLTEAPVSAKEAASGAPNPEKYQYGELDPQYVSDLADFRADLKIQAFKAELRQEREAEQRETVAQREAAARLERAEKISNDGAGKYSDFDATVVPWAESQDPQQMLAVFEAASETSVGADIFYHLAKNPTEAAEVMSLSPMQRMLWMARFEAKAAVPQPKKVSSAPAPIGYSRGSGAASSVRMDDLDDPRALDAIERELYGRRK
jgi:hypothetical protein